MGKQSRLLALVLALVIGAIYWIGSHPPKLGLDLRGGAQLTLQAEPKPEEGIPKITPRIMEAAKYVVEQRINGLGVAEATIVVSGETQLSVQLPGVDNPAQAERVLGKTAQLDFRKQRQGTEGQFRAELTVQKDLQIKQQYLKASADQAEIAENEAAIKRNKEAIRGLFDRTGLTGQYLKDAGAVTGQSQGAWDVALTFDDKGGDLFAKTTGELGGTGRSLGIFLDDELISYPSVGVEFQGKGITGNHAVITGSKNLEGATELALQLRAGALPVPVKLVENRTVGATLGADSVQSSIYAGVAGLVLVLVFMVAYYKLLGVVADVALLVYAVITYAAFSVLGVVLTLPGIAGFILSIGIAVDANVLIFERIREELRSGRSLYKSVEAGFNRAWASILDGHVTTIISCVALFWLGSGLVKGFAVTLGLGVAVSLFTAVTCSRSLLLTVITYPNLRKPSFYGVRAIGKPNNYGVSSAQAEITVPSEAVENDAADESDRSANDKTKGATL
ncbi:protein translocase subunit SecD [Tumidithrix elongata RA019]|uniref:Protein translocase subunit SecD n=1 Tax=Tumidithrix elongata BACA0141 TaxID=2716417 RepID=A0AAW9PT72_9CYAN|nr:protein translocase subunit SecD [Tumidithrix elongata RA019]